ncbi:MAG TPA: hypothetical protein VKA68_13100 [bacterium]|nr:hypothetical protein [bacterium]
MINEKAKTLFLTDLSSVAFALPWCCIIPAGLSFLAVSFTAAGRIWLGQLTWVFLPLSILFLARAIWLNLIRRQGASWTRWVTAGSTLLVIMLWIFRYGESIVKLIG